MTSRNNSQRRRLVFARNTRRKTRRNSNVAAAATQATHVNGNVAHSIQMFFSMLTNIRLYHWTTTSYARHTGSGALYDTLSSLIDQFVETFMGRYARPEFKHDANAFSVEVNQLNDDNVVDVLNMYCDFLQHEIPKHVDKSDSDLLNIRDEMLGEIHKTMYLFTLH
jgi:hypothetical protein